MQQNQQFTNLLHMLKNDYSSVWFTDYSDCIIEILSQISLHVLWYMLQHIIAHILILTIGYRPFTPLKQENFVYQGFQINQNSKGICVWKVIHIKNTVKQFQNSTLFVK